MEERNLRLESANAWRESKKKKKTFFRKKKEKKINSLKDKNRKE